MLYCWRTREGCIGSQHTVAKESIDIAPTRDHKQIGQNYFVRRVAQTGALLPRPGKGKRCCLVSTATKAQHT